MPPEPFEPALDRVERRSCRSGEREEDPAPDGPAERAALRERQEERQHRNREQSGPERVDTRGVLGVTGRDVPPREDEADQPDRDVDEEDRPPALAAEIRRDDRATGQLADDRSHAGGRAEQPERASAPLARRRGLDRCEHLRDHEGRRCPLGDAERNQRHVGRRDAAEEREERERRHAEHEQPPPPVQVAEPPAEDEEQGVRDPVARNHQLERRRGGVQVGRNCGECDVDDEEVGDREKCADENRREAEP